MSHEDAINPDYEKPRKVGYNDNRVLSEDQVMQIRTMLNNKVKQRSISEKFNIHPTTVSNISNNRTYKNYGMI